MFVGPAIIALREGIEIALIISIILSYLKKTQKMHLKNYVIGGVGMAFLTSVGVGVVLGLVWGFFEGVSLNIFEGAITIVAAILLTTMILWMWRVGSGISTEIRSSLAERTVAGGGIGLALLAFALVLREGVETVLFTIALAFEDAFQTYVGVTVGLAVAFVIGVAIYKQSLRISLGRFFSVTSVFLILFAAGMVAYGIHELQEAGLLLFGPLEMWNINPPLLPDGTYPLLHENGLIGSVAKALFGYDGNPSALEVLAYTTYLLIVSLYYISRRKQIQEKTDSNEQTEDQVVVT